MWKPAGPVTGIGKYGLVDTSPLRDFLLKYIKAQGETYHRKVAMAAVNIDDGSYEIFDETLSTEDKVNAVMSSSAFPFAFPSQHWTFKGKKLNAMDGYVAWNLNLVSAIRRCKEIVGDDESKITLDVINVGTTKLPKYDKDKGNTINNWLRYQDLKNYNDGVRDVAAVMAAYPEVNFRHYVSPS